MTKDEKTEWSRLNHKRFNDGLTPEETERFDLLEKKNQIREATNKQDGGSNE
jgi:hypothetical protein